MVNWILINQLDICSYKVGKSLTSGGRHVDLYI